MNAITTERRGQLPLTEFLSNYPLRVFTPCAYYDKHMDCIRVQIRDCSVTEERVDELVTMLRANNPAAEQSQYVGFTIKGVRYLFSKLSIPLAGVLRVTDLLHEITRNHPEYVVDKIVDRFQQLLRDTELAVDFAEAA